MNTNIWVKNALFENFCLAICRKMEMSTYIYPLLLKLQKLSWSYQVHSRFLLFFVVAEISNGHAHTLPYIFCHFQVTRPEKRRSRTSSFTRTTGFSSRRESLPQTTNMKRKKSQNFSDSSRRQKSRENS